MNWAENEGLQLVVFAVALAGVAVSLVIWIAVVVAQRTRISRVLRAIKSEREDWWSELQRESEGRPLNPPIHAALKTFEQRVPHDDPIAVQCARLQRLNRWIMWTNLVLITSAFLLVFSLNVLGP